ncbi:hypothetical protein DMC47_13990 [Nostoc sp. 3335mG]|nr:hypothetical protein DMC47_13990 [Nostoc sp. 3335mG]
MSAFDIALDYQRDCERRGLANPYHLSNAESDLARQLLSGRSLSEIAGKLSVSEAGLQQQVERLCGKVGANGMTHLLHLLATLPGLRPETGLVDIDDFRTAFGLGGPFRPA